MSDINTQYPATKLTVSGTDGAVLATQPLPVNGVITGTASNGYTCTASLTIPVPKRAQYQVDAFGFRTATGAGPFNFPIP